MRRKAARILLYIIMALCLGACGRKKEGFDREKISKALVYSYSMELKYAERFSVDYYEGGYALIRIVKETGGSDDVGGLRVSDDSSDWAASDYFLVIPKGGQIPADLPSGIVLLQQPIRNIYLAASAAMDMFVSADALDRVRFSGFKAEGWYIPKAREAMEQGRILYAGKYAAPDYERIVSEGCGLAVENTMIYHTPQVKEQLERFGVPVLVDYSSYEREPLGRAEWVRLYGLLAEKEDSAREAFESELARFDAVAGQEGTGKTVAFFYITENGGVNVRKSSDYLPKMIELAGGKYIFQDLGDESSRSSTITLQMEEFYAAAKEADYLIYNSTVEGELNRISDLTEKSSLLENFKAVKAGNVFCTSKNLYQSSMALGTIISDIHGMLAGEEDGLSYLYRLE